MIRTLKTKLLNFHSSLMRLMIRINILPRERTLGYENMELAFEDDFNGRKLDTNKWMTHYYWGHTSSDYEHQFYSSEAFSLKDSILTINVENRKVKGWYMKDGKRTSKNFDVTSGLIHTGEYFKQRYGRFEIRCKVPMEKGYMPSFWLINSNSYPPEIDVMEFDEGDNDVLSVGHVYGDADVDDMLFNVKKAIQPLDLGCEFNTYTLDWTPHKLIWYVNGYEVFRVKSQGIPHTPMYVAINMAIGRDAAHTEAAKKMQIDWIRVYKFTK